MFFVNFCNFLFQSVLNFQFLQYAPLLILRSLYYPIKDIFGNSLCYYTSHSEVFTMFLSQYQSFFITLFRYICLFQNQLVVNLDLKPRNLAQITVFCLFFISILTSSFIILGSDPTLTLQACLGNYVMSYDRNGHNICSQGTVFENHRKSLIQHCERSELLLHF